MEQYIINHCAPTLAGIKVASMFNISASNRQAAMEKFALIQAALAEKGVSLKVLSETEKGVLIYIYRPKLLENLLKRQQVKDFLNSMGYSDFGVESVLFFLSERIKESGTFPHEVGVLLGYPLEDVLGFIQNCGKNCKCVGCWKVYCNECEAVKFFEKVNRCRSRYISLFSKGMSVLQLTLAV